MRPVSLRNTCSFGEGEIAVWASVRNPNSARGNLGDRFGYLLAETLLKKSVKRLGVSDNQLVDERTFYLCGSILQWVTGEKSPVVIGPGFISDSVSAARLKGSKLLGVRGDLSRAMAEQTSGSPVRVVSDPGLLFPDVMKSMGFLPVHRPRNRKGVCFVIHGVDRDEFTRRGNHEDLTVADQYGDIESFARAIDSAALVVSSSLHGIIFSHSLGVPVIPLASLSGQVLGGDFKFRDYFSSLKLSQSLVCFSEGEYSEVQWLSMLSKVRQPRRANIALRQIQLRREIRQALSLKSHAYRVFV